MAVPSWPEAAPWVFSTVFDDLAELLMLKAHTDETRVLTETKAMSAAFTASIESMKAPVADVADMLRLLGTPTRLMLLCHIAQIERSVTELESDLGLKQPGLPQQLAELRPSDVIATRRQSRSVHYSITDARLISLLAALCGFFCADSDAGSTIAAAVPAKRPQRGDTARIATVARR
ncbi:MAG: metalloregulator ArsR/SmtB family transcription factor [Dokdonella sp.]